MLWLTGKYNHEMWGVARQADHSSQDQLQLGMRSEGVHCGGRWAFSLLSKRSERCRGTVEGSDPISLGKVSKTQETRQT